MRMSRKLTHSILGGDDFGGLRLGKYRGSLALAQGVEMLPSQQYLRLLT